MRWRLAPTKSIHVSTRLVNTYKTGARDLQVQGMILLTFYLTAYGIKIQYAICIVRIVLLGFCAVLVERIEPIPCGAAHAYRELN